MKYPVLSKLLSKKIQAAPSKRAEYKEALKNFVQPDFNQAQFTISTSKAIGFDGYDVTISLPVDKEFLKHFQMGDLVHQVHDWVKERCSIFLGQPSVGDNQKRAKNGYKTITFTWMISDPVVAYALGAKLGEYSFHGPVLDKKAIKKRFALAEEKAEASAALRREIKAGKRPETDWKPWVEELRQMGMNWQIAKMIPVEGQTVLSQILPLIS